MTSEKPARLPVLLRVGLERVRQGRRTIAYPHGPAPELPERFRGRPVVDLSQCGDGGSACIEACPTGALSAEGGDLRLDMGRCIFCGECAEACPTGAIRFTPEFRLAARERADLTVDGREQEVRAALDLRLRRLFGRSLKLRLVSAGGCNACEADANVLTTVGWDIGRFGIGFVPSPRHADGLLITGPVTQNMRLALEETYAALAAPRIVIAIGACAISGGLFADHPEVLGGADGVVPVDLFVPGCPPHPLTLFDGLLRLLGRIVDDPVRFPSGRDAERQG